MLLRQFLAILLLTVLGSCAIGPARGVPVEKAIWVSRYEYKTAADIDRIMAECAAAGFRSVMFQVRGNGTVHFASRREVWSDRFGYRPPNFDPLSHAVLAAHSHGLKLHAWMNIMPGWGGKAAPRSRSQLWHRHPDWFLRTERGEKATEGNYWFLNPCLPEVRQYLVGLCKEVVAGYAVDGLHLDYIRFPHGRVSERSPGDPRSRALFERQTGRSINDLEAFRAWKAGAITELMRQIRGEVQRSGRRVPITVAVNANMDRIRQDVLQDWPRWAQSGLVEAVFPMNYTEDDGLFARRSRECIAAAGGAPVIMGVGVYAHQRAGRGSQLTVRQMNAALRMGSRGVCLFSYGSSMRGEWEPAIRSWNLKR